MGKQTRNHPLPLSVLRGALEYCGWKFKTLRWEKDNEWRKDVLYRIDKLIPPPDAPQMDVHAVAAALQACFTPQVRVTGVTHNTNTGLKAWFAVTKPPKVTEDDLQAAQLEHGL